MPNENANFYYSNSNTFMTNTSQTMNMTNMAQTLNSSPNVYQQILYVQSEIYRQQREFQEQLIKERYPVRIAMLFSLILVVLSLVEIVMQLLLVINKGPLYFVGWGFWIGAIGIIFAILVLFTSKTLNWKLNRNIMLKISMKKGKNLGIGWFRTTQIVGLLIPNLKLASIIIISINSFGKYRGSSWCLISQNCIDTSTQSFLIVMIVCASLSVLAYYIFFFYVNSKLNMRRIAMEMSNGQQIMTFGGRPQ